MERMTTALLVLIVFLAVALLRTRLHNRWEVRMEVGQLRMQRSLTAVMREVLGPAVWLCAGLAVLALLSVIDLLVSALVLGIGILFLMGYLAAVLRFGSVIFDLLEDRVQRGERLVGRAREVQTVEFGEAREPLQIVFRYPDGLESRWPIRGVDRGQAPELAMQIGTYLRVAVRPVESPA
jgi:hypothetical protein